MTRPSQPRRRHEIEPCPSEPPRVHLERIGDDAVVLAYGLNIGWPSPSVDWLMTTVYVNHDGQWVGIFRMETR